MEEKQQVIVTNWTYEGDMIKSKRRKNRYSEKDSVKFYIDKDGKYILKVGKNYYRGVMQCNINSQLYPMGDYEEVLNDKK